MELISARESPRYRAEIVRWGFTRFNSRSALNRLHGDLAVKECCAMGDLPAAPLLDSLGFRMKGRDVGVDLSRGIYTQFRPRRTLNV